MMLGVIMLYWMSALGENGRSAEGFWMSVAGGHAEIVRSAFAGITVLFMDILATVYPGDEPAMDRAGP